MHDKNENTEIDIKVDPLSLVDGDVYRAWDGRMIEALTSWLCGIKLRVKSSLNIWSFMLL